VIKPIVLVIYYSLNDLAHFIKEVDIGLNEPLKEGDIPHLISIMDYLIRIKERQSQTDEMFEPLKQTIELLKVYNQDMPDEVHQQLQVVA